MYVEGLRSGRTALLRTQAVDSSRRYGGPDPREPWRRRVN